MEPVEEAHREAKRTKRERKHSIQPHIGINCLPAINHQPEFAAACVTQEADKAVLDGALAMAWTTIDLALDHTVRDQLMQK